ncbi:citrinin biosynthesis oxygenase CtnA [Trichoderma harzianum]|uniref:2-oxoglutarate-dependent dioxygenase thnC n=1 Tax=Trichoderma harzianum TaxID=5544 RepID=THNC_TRIHA|nr:RecName: Full=2-oxoglutarate-dependent dioxygenase thnC; AltName: Full=Trihazone biosynthesis cluster protein C [Trichoderma harzianum]KKP04697.1 citrinin biosynthesis oxygenase CtnA [Trichoderma harzianum]
MSEEDISLPIIDLSGYLSPKSPDDRQNVIEQIRDACRDFGFFQLKGHGIPISLQKELLKSLGTLFSMPKEEKMKLSYLENPCRRGYEASGMSMREGDAMPDSKEAYYLGREDPVVEFSGFYGPNVWPNLPEEDFRGPVWEYYQKTSQLGKTIWEVLLQGLGYSTDLMEAFAKRPLVQMKLIRYPSPSVTLPGQFGVGAHNDFGGVTVLLQQAGKDGLEVWLEKQQKWLSVPALEDVYVINCGDMIMKWSGGRYKSVRHRVINKTEGERHSCATFWHGDVFATNPLNPEDPNKETVGQLLVKRFRHQMSIHKEGLAQVGEL